MNKPINTPGEQALIDAGFRKSPKTFQSETWVREHWATMVILSNVGNVEIVEEKHRGLPNMKLYWNMLILQAITLRLQELQEAHND